MQCSHCGKSDWVTIGNQKYCANCGEPATAEASGAAPAVVQPAATQPAKVAAKPAPVPIAPVTPGVASVTQPPAPTPAPQMPPQLKPGAIFSDVALPSSPAAPAKVNPANSFHAGPASAAPSPVLDLRQMAPQPVNPVAKLVVPVPVPAPTPTPAPVAKPTPTPTPAPEPKPAPIVAAVSVPKPAAMTDMKPLVVANPTTPAPLPVASTPVVTPVAPPAAVPASQITKFIRPQTAPVAPVTASVATAMPAPVATQIQAMQKLATAASTASDPTASRESAFKIAMSSGVGPSIKSVGAATLAIAIMGGYIWLNNYNTLTVKAAGQKAGIQASLPGYMPSSYTLSGPVAYSQGAVTMEFKSPSAPGGLKISQTRTNWNSASLLQLYVNNKANSYVSVQNQGLTIYLYNDNEATWVNKGLQYVIEGNTKLSREQVLKIAESL